MDLAIVGAGTMGAGIAQVAVQHGLSVVLYDAAPEELERGVARVYAGLGGLLERRRITASEHDAALGRLSMAPSLDDLASAPFVIEAVPEDLDLKRTVFERLDAVCAPTAILASNTSSISITRIAAATTHPARVVGMHFFNPVYALRLVEVVAGHLTTDETVRAVEVLVARLGKTPVRAKDTPGFIVNRVARPFYGEALRILAEGVPVETIDRVMRAGAGFPMGPFELMDLIGLDVNFAVTTSIYAAFFGEPRYRPHPIQDRMVAAGTLGKKTGRGFYRYDENGAKIGEDDAQR